MKWGRSRALALCLLLAACDEAPTGVQPDPCAATFACLVPGVDLSVSSFTVQTAGMHGASGLAMIGDTVRGEVRVRNRGDRSADDGTLLVQLPGGSWDIDLPSLQPGEERAFPLQIVIDIDHLIGLRDERVAVEAAAFHPADTVQENDSRTAGPYVLRAPLLQLTTTTGVGTAGGTLPATFTITNYSSTTTAPATLWAICLFDSFNSCAPSARTLTGTFMLPAVPPGGVVTTQLEVALPPTSTHLDQAFEYEGYACRLHAPVTSLPAEAACQRITGAVKVRPDYERVCAPPSLTSTATRLAAWNCGNPELPRTLLRPAPFHLLALDAEAGITYRIERSSAGSSLRLHDAAGEPVPDLAPAADEVRVGATERIYIVSYSAVPDVTFRAVRTPGQP